MKALVTGASGFIGKNLLLSLPHEWDIVAVYHRAIDFCDFLADHGLSHIRTVRADLSTRAGARAIAAREGRYDVVVHLAANGDPAVSVEAPAFDLASNTLTVVTLLEAITCGRFVFMSSGAVYDGLGGPVTPASAVAPRLPYAISKLAAEHYLRHFQRRGRIGQIVSIRFFGAYGPHEPPRKIYSRLVRQFAFSGDPRFTIRGDGHNLIDAMYISDAVRALQLLISAPAGRDIVDLATGHPLTLTELVKSAARAFGLEPEISYDGHVPEYIEFHSSDAYMAEQLEFSLRVPLEDGLRRLHQHMAAA